MDFEAIRGEQERLLWLRNRANLLKHGYKSQQTGRGSIVSLGLSVIVAVTPVLHVLAH